MECKICGFDSKLSLVSHITRKHKIAISEYKSQFNSEVQIISKEQKNNISNTLKEYYTADVKDDMSAKMKNGGSWRCKSYWTDKGYSEQDAMNKIHEKQSYIAHKRTKILPEENVLRKEYWIKRQGLTENDAILHISNMQKDRGKNSKRFLGKTRDTEQKRKISISMSKMIKRVGKEKWALHFGDFKESFKSRGEIELYKYVKENINENAECNVFVDDYNVDVIYENTIIEYFGDYWHCNPDKYESDYYHQIRKMTAREIWDADSLRTKCLQQLGYDVKIVWENDWNNNKWRG